MTPRRDDTNQPRIDTPHLSARIADRGYVSGIVAGTFLDRKTGARDLGFGLDVVDFLLEPADPDAPIPPGQYEFGPTSKVHGAIPKRYVEGPQICTQAKRLDCEVLPGDGFTAVRLRYRWTQAYPPHDQAGSLWEQTLILPHDRRYILAADRVTTVAESPCLFLRTDQPGHIKHREGRGFEHIYLSYNDPTILPSTEFVADFPPDARYLYQRKAGRTPERFIRAYQVDAGPDGGDGPWLAGMTLNADDVYEAWCHQRGYVCMIQEIGGRAVKPGDTFGACYVIGWFDDIDAMHDVYDRFRGLSGLLVRTEDGKATSYQGLTQRELTPVRP